MSFNTPHQDFSGTGQLYRVQPKSGAVVKQDTLAQNNRSHETVHVWKEFRCLDAMVWLTPAEKECMEVALYIEMQEWNVENIWLGTF